MDSQRINELLDKYYRGETSLDEEQLLKEYFGQQNLSDINFVDKQMVDFFATNKTKIPADLSKEFDSLIDSAWENETKLRFSTVLKWAGSVAAVIVVAVGILIYTNQKPTLLADSYKDPQQAYEETKKVLLYISNTMNNKTSSLKHLTSVDKSLNHISELSKIDESLKTLKNENN